MTDEAQNLWAVDVEFQVDRYIDPEEFMERQGKVMDLSAVGVWQRDGLGGGLDLAVKHGEDPREALDYAIARVRDAFEGYELVVTGFSVTTWEKFEENSSKPLIPELVSIAEAAELAGISRQRAHQLYKAGKDFPSIVQETKQGPLVLRSAAEYWAKTRNKKSGRPKKSDSD